MAQRAGPGATGSAALSALFDDAVQGIGVGQSSRPGRGANGAPAGDGYLYSGNRHESVPRALFLDRRLTPLERNAWQVFRLRLNSDGLTAFPSYDELRPHLASMPCTALASHETVARALTLLRLTRWLSLVRRRRDPASGRILGNLYVLHDEPVTPFEAMQLDPDYLSLVSQALAHAARAVQVVGAHVLQEIAEDPMLSGRTLPTRLEILAQRMATLDSGGQSYPQEDAVHDSEEGQDGLLRNRDAPSSDSEPGRKPARNHSLRNPKSDSTSTVRIESFKEVRTVPRANLAQRLRMPERFLALKQPQQAGALVALQQVDEAFRQAVLDEWDARCRGDVVRNPAGYLFGIIQKAIRGDFRAWAGEEDRVSPTSVPTSASSATVAGPPAEDGVEQPHAGRAAARAYLARLKSATRGT